MRRSVTLGALFTFALGAVPVIGSCGAESAPPSAVESEQVERFVSARRYSIEDYASVAARALPIADAADTALRAFVPTRLHAVELDLFEDDILQREGAMVLLGHEGGRVVALTTRRSIDAAYPSEKLIVDGFGAAEIGEQSLELRSDVPGCTAQDVGCPDMQFKLHAVGLEGADGVSVRTFDRHDVALVYLPANAPGVAQRPTLGLDEPTARVTSELARSEQMYGLGFTLVSNASFDELRDGVATQSIGGRLLVFAAAAALDPLVGAAFGSLEVLDPIILDRIEGGLAKLGAQQIEMLAGPLLDRVEASSGRGEAHGYIDALARDVEPAAAELIAVSELHIAEDGRIDWPGGEGARWLGVDLRGRDAAQDARALIRGMVEEGELLVIDFGESGLLLLAPGERIVLNEELIGHEVGAWNGDPSVASIFPEFAAVR